MYINGNKTSEHFTATPEKYPQKQFKDKSCRRCSKVFKPLGPSHLYCTDECAAEAYADRLLKRNYGIDYSTVKSLYEQQARKCAICGGEGFKMAEHHKLKLVVDHCHATGKVRGLLCHNCNRGLGLFKDSITNLLRAIEYLEGATTIPEGSTPKRVEARDIHLG